MTIHIKSETFAAVQELADARGMGLDALVDELLTQAIEQDRIEAFFRDRARGADLDAAIAFLRREPSGEPLPDDQWPADWTPEEIAAARG